jgi:hypothetical protein
MAPGPGGDAHGRGVARTRVLRRRRGKVRRKSGGVRIAHVSGRGTGESEGAQGAVRGVRCQEGADYLVDAGIIKGLECPVQERIKGDRRGLPLIKPLGLGRVAVKWRMSPYPRPT